MMESYQAEDDNPFVKIFENSHVTQEDHLQVDISTFPPDSLPIIADEDIRMELDNKMEVETTQNGIDYNHSNGFHEHHQNGYNPEIFHQQQQYLEEQQFLTPKLEESEQVNNELSQENGDTPKKKGRAKKGPIRKSHKPKRSHPYEKVINPKDYVEKLPKMRPNIHCIELSNENIEKYRKQDSFIQPGVCFKIAPELNQCKACVNHKKYSEVECRFFQFRKLRFNGDAIEVVGFLTSVDPKDVDRIIWMPGLEKSKFKVPPQESKLMLQYCGDELCYIIEKEKKYLKKHKKDDEPIIWKRLIDSVSEICDLCSTTLFNFHFICSICGISLCVDCIDESKDGTFDTSCSINDKERHTLSDLKLTQIIVEDSMEKLQNLLHQTCQLWKIDHKCELNEVVDFASFNLAKNIMQELITGKSILNREIPHKLVPVEKVKEPLNPSENNPNLSLDLTSALKEVMEVNEKLCAVNKVKKVHKPIRHNTECEREVIISIPRLMCPANSHLRYPDVPHSWLCQGKLLQLHDPSHVRNTEIFEDQWKRGQPIVVSNVSKSFQHDLWIPQSFDKEFGSETSDFINCLNGNIVRNREMSEFWNGFEHVSERIKDTKGIPVLLKLKDWPPDKDFAKVMPTRFKDFMDNLPLNSYTTRTGDLNIVKYLPTCFLHPDLGPKGYFAFGDPFFSREGTTNLHLDVSDACNVMIYVGFPQDVSTDVYIEEGRNAMIEADCDRSNIMRAENGEIPGAIWHIYQAADADRIRDFLQKLLHEKGTKIDQGHDAIHDQNWYLNKEMRQRLYEEYSVEGYAIVQYVGDCIVLPAGTPHQVRNLYSCIKVAEDFVSPQQISHCLHLSTEFRKLTVTHTNNEEKINVKNVVYHTCKEAIAALRNQISRRMGIAQKSHYASMNNGTTKKDKAPKKPSKKKKIENDQNNEILKIKEEPSC